MQHVDESCNLVAKVPKLSLITAQTSVSAAEATYALLWLKIELHVLDGWMDILEVGPGVGRDALIMQQIMTQIQ